MEENYHLGVKAIIQNSEGKILLLKVNPKNLRGFAGEPYWDIPGGRVKRGSSVEETLRREVDEETGITVIKHFKPFSMVLSNIRIPLESGSVGLILSAYLCDVDEVKKVDLSEEHVEFGWFSPQEASELLLVKYPKEFVEKLRNL